MCSTPVMYCGIEPWCMMAEPCMYVARGCPRMRPARDAGSVAVRTACGTDRRTRIQSGRFGPHPKHRILRRMHVLHESPSRSSSHFLGGSRRGVGQLRSQTAGRVAYLSSQPAGPVARRGERRWQTGWATDTYQQPPLPAEWGGVHLGIGGWACCAPVCVGCHQSHQMSCSCTGMCLRRSARRCWTGRRSRARGRESCWGR
ncbi:hypothetical protein B0H21DRAFT_47392 [Amylocystis lapponica]|nr:hypothetical protein B0H21DRAFT_47392 [Amylocystis lapponica]